MGNKSLF